MQQALLIMQVYHKTLFIYLKELILILPLHIAWPQHVVAELGVGCGSPIIQNESQEYMRQ